MMPNEPKTNDDVSLWTCLHDGSLESIASDPMARSLTFVFDVPYIWEFHKHPESSRFHLALGNVSKAVALDHSPWPRELKIPEGLSWEESQKLRWDHYAKGRSQSIDWLTTAKKLSTSNDYDISNATYLEENNQVILKLEITDHEDEYSTLEITAETLATSLNGTRELSREEFLSLGNAYWDAFGKHAS